MFTVTSPFHRPEKVLSSASPVSPPATPATLPPPTFKDFFEDRDANKLSLYKKVVLYGIAVLFVSALPLFIGIALLSDVSDTTRYALGQVLSVVGGFFFSAGLCAASSVPVSSYNIEKGMKERPPLRRAIVLVLTVFFLGFGAICSCLPPYAPSFPAVLLALWLALHELHLDKWPLLFKVACNTVCASVCATQVFFANAWLADAMAKNVTGVFTDAGDARVRAVYSITGTVIGALYVCGIVFTVALCCHKLRPHIQACTLRGGLVLKADIDTKWPGWSTEMFYTTLYMVLYELGVAFTLNGINTVIVRGLSPVNLIGYVFCSIVFILPPVFLLVYGKDSSFTLLARYFEFNLKRLQQDGALMAYLVSKASSKLHDKQKQQLDDSDSANGGVGPVWWIKRALDDKTLVSENPNHIKRCFWAKGEIELITDVELPAPSASSPATPAKRMIVHVKMMNDIDRSWAAFYKTENSLTAVGSFSASSGSCMPFQGGRKEALLRIEAVAEAVPKGGAEHSHTSMTPESIDLDCPPRPRQSENFEAWKERLDPRHYQHWREKNFGTGAGSNAPWEPPKREDTFDIWMQRLLVANNGKASGSKSISTSTVLVEEGNVIEYFGSTARLEEDRKAHRATLIITVPVKEMEESDMMEWATDSDNFRSFNWEDRKLDLFSLSPRQLSSKVERDFLFALSHPTSIRSNADKLDYFVSHSWEYNGDDTGENKYEKVKEFMEKQRADLKHYPTLWLDKVCINQNDTSQAISVLPIIIGGCKQVLILLSPTYLTRLWCVWELFTLFTFCNKELALQRVVVLPLVDFPDPSQSGNLSTAAASADSTSPSTAASQESLFNKLATFDIDDAHCFDPNEELKLRQVISEIGFDRLSVVFEQLRKNFTDAVLLMRKEEQEKVDKEKESKAVKVVEAVKRVEKLKKKKEKHNKRKEIEAAAEAERSRREAEGSRSCWPVSSSV